MEFHPKSCGWFWNIVYSQASQPAPGGLKDISTPHSFHFLARKHNTLPNLNPQTKNNIRNIERYINHGDYLF
jgi:hypothetical protein